MMDMEEGMGMLYNLRVALSTERGWRECLFVWTRKKGKERGVYRYSTGATEMDTDMEKGV